MIRYQEGSDIARRLTKILISTLCLIALAGAVDAAELAVDRISLEPRRALSHMERNRMKFPDTPCVLNESDIEIIVQNLEKTGRFKSVSWQHFLENNHWVLQFSLQPLPFVKTLSFSGNHQVSDSRLERASDLRKFQPYSEEILNRSLIQLRDYYLVNGFPAVRFRTDTQGPDTNGAVGVTVHVREIDLPKAESFEVRITGYPGLWWRSRLKSVFGWFKWKAKRRGLNMEALRKLVRREERALKESGYRNARIDIHQEPGSVQCHPVLLVEIMVEKPIRLKFENIGLLTRRDIVHNWKRKHTGMNEKELERLVNQTRDRLHKDGWISADISSSIVEINNKIVALIHADKGLRRHIETVDLTGRTPIDPDDLGKITGLHEPRLLGTWKTRPGDETIDNAQRAMKTHLENLGYPRPSCRIKTIEPNPGEIAVTVDADAGPRRTIGTINFTGNDGMTRQQLLKTIQIATGDPFVRRHLKDAMTTITRAYWEQGYADVKMQAKTQRSGSVVNVGFSINEGPKYLQGPLILNGNVKTRSNLIYRLKRIATGDPFNMEALGKWQKAMYRTGVFESVSIHTEKHTESSPPYQTVIMEITERSTGDFETGLDFNTDRGVEFILELGERNLFGQALNGRFSGLVGQERWLAAFTLVRPIFFGYPLENRLRAAITDDRTNSGYNLRTYEVEMSTIYHWDNDVSLNMTYAFEREDLRDIDVDVSDEIDLENTRSGSLTPILTIDRRDDPFRTTDGWFYRTRIKGSFNELGSDVEFLRWDHDFRLFQPLNSDGDVILGGALRFGRSWTIQDSVMPAGERFFLGGASTNRGFEHKLCGPRTADRDPLGGLSYILANLELRFHLAGRLHGAVFFDAGNTFENTPEAPYFRPSTGFGLRLETPIGPFRADFGLNLDPEEDEPDYVMQIALGHAF